MTSGKALVLCLIADAALVVVSLSHHYHDNWLRSLSMAMVLLSFLVFMSWIRRMTSMQAIEDALNAGARQELEEDPEPSEEEQQLAEERRQRRNARQRERYAVRKAQEAADERAAVERRKPKAAPTPPAPAPKTEPKSAWDRLLADDED